MENSINIDDRSIRKFNFRDRYVCDSGRLHISILPEITKRLLKAQKDRDKADKACGLDYKNTRKSTMVKFQRCAEELSFWADMLQYVLEDMNHNGYSKDQ